MKAFLLIIVVAAVAEFYFLFRGPRPGPSGAPADGGRVRPGATGEGVDR
jgi:hypothetical protein